MTTPIHADSEARPRPRFEQSVDTIRIAYGIAFLFALFWNLGTVCAVALHSPQIEQNLRIFYPVFTVVLSIQLLEIYANLHRMDIQIGNGDHPHFVHLLLGNAKNNERLLRILLGATLVAFAKSSSQIFNIDGFPILPNLALIICFSLLMAWDFLVLKSLRQIQPNDADAKTVVWVVARTYFWVDPSDGPASKWSGYFSMDIKRPWVRLAGLIGAIGSLLFLLAPTVPLTIVWVLGFGFYLVGAAFHARSSRKKLMILGPDAPDTFSEAVLGDFLLVLSEIKKLTERSSSRLVNIIRRIEQRRFLQFNVSQQIPRPSGHYYIGFAILFLVAIGSFGFRSRDIRRTNAYGLERLHTPDPSSRSEGNPSTR